MYMKTKEKPLDKTGNPQVYGFELTRWKQTKTCYPVLKRNSSTLDFRHRKTPAPFDTGGLGCITL